MIILDNITNDNNNNHNEKWPYIPGHPYRILIIGGSGSGKANTLLNLISEQKDMIADIMTNKKFQSIIKELFIRCKKLNISLVFITQSYFSVPKDVRLSSTHYLIMKINNKR